MTCSPFYVEWSVNLNQSISHDTSSIVYSKKLLWQLSCYFVLVCPPVFKYCLLTPVNFSIVLVVVLMIYWDSDWQLWIVVCQMDLADCSFRHWSRSRFSLLEVAVISLISDVLTTVLLMLTFSSISSKPNMLIGLIIAVFISGLAIFC